MRNKPGLSIEARALQYLARREYSCSELRAKLQPHVQEGEDIDAVLDELLERGWLSDERAATQWVHAKRGRFGAQRITHELRQKGIADNLIEKAMVSLEASELDVAREVWQRKFGTLPQDAREKAKQMRFLQSRGFSGEVIYRVLQCAESEV